MGKVAWIQESRLNNAPSSRVLSQHMFGTLLDELTNAYNTVIAAMGAGHIRKDATNTLDPAKVITAASDQTAVNAYINDLVAKATLHFAVAAPTHIGADATNAFADATNPASDLASSITAVNDAKDVLNAHYSLAAATGHYQADAYTPQIASADADDLPSVIVLALECGTTYTTHIGAQALIGAPTSAPISLVTKPTTS